MKFIKNIKGNIMKGVLISSVVVAWTTIGTWATIVVINTTIIDDEHVAESEIIHKEDTSVSQENMRLFKKITENIINLAN